MGLQTMILRASVIISQDRMLGDRASVIEIVLQTSLETSDTQMPLTQVHCHHYVQMQSPILLNMGLTFSKPQVMQLHMAGLAFPLLTIAARVSNC